MSQVPAVKVLTDPVVLDGGMDLISAPGYAAAGTCRFASNYELEFGGGYRRVGGFERIDGRFRPHLAEYLLLESSTGFTGAVLGNTLTGFSSGATGVVVYVSANRLGLTKLGVTPFLAEVVKVGAVTIGTVTELQPVIDGFLDNELSENAANLYRADILKPLGDSPIRGVAVLNNALYCWREVSNALVTYKATALGWVVVPLSSQISFNGGSTAYTEGSVLSKGGATATVLRVVLESGSYGAGTAAGRLIITPISGVFTAGLSGGGGVANLLGGASVIPMFGGGRVMSVVYNFTGLETTRRLYCCDGINIEWEFDGTVVVPLSTGMAGLRATTVFCHKNHLFYSYRSSLQHSGTAAPYKWAPLFGAGELTTGDTITNLVSVSGSESSSSLMAVCLDSVWVLYGNSLLDWDFKRISDQAGAMPYSAVEMNGVLAFDRDGFRNYKPTIAFGNFSYESASRGIDPLVRNATPKAAVLVKNKGLCRFFFSDGLFVTGTPVGTGIGWMPGDYGFTVECAVGGEINGQYRVFMGAFDGTVYESDVGRSFDGATVTANMRLTSLSQRNNVALKQYRHFELDTQTESAFALALGAEFSDSDPDIALVTASSLTDFKKMYGSGLFWDFNSWDRAYWDVSNANRVRYPIHGQGRSVSLLVLSEASNELPHTLKSGTVIYTPRRLSR